MAVNLVTGLTPEELNALSDVPALSPPPGIQSNFVNPQNQTLSFLLVTSILFGMMGIFFVNRVYTKAFIIKKYTWDDLTIVIAFISSIAYYVVSIWGVQEGRVGVHQWDINIPNILNLNLLIPEYLASILTGIALLFTKATFFFMYLSLFGPMRWLRVSAWLGLMVNTVFYLAMLIANMIFSTPRPGQSWQQAAVSEQGTLALSIPQAVGGLIIDLYILVLPIIAVSKLQLPPRRKLGVILIFMSGALAVAASVLKIYYSYILINTADLTWASLPVNIVTFTEISVGISCACMPSAAHTCRHHASSFGYVKKAFSWNSKSLSLQSSSRNNSPTSPSSDQNGLLEKNETDDKDPYSRIESHGIQSQRWIHDQEFQIPGVHCQSAPTKIVTAMVSGGKQDVTEQNENYSPYTRFNSQTRVTPKRLRPSTVTRTQVSEEAKFERSREPYSKFNNQRLQRQTSYDDIPPPVPLKDTRQALPSTLPGELHSPKVDNTIIRGASQDHHERSGSRSVASGIYRSYEMRTDVAVNGHF